MTNQEIQEQAENMYPEYPTEPKGETRYNKDINCFKKRKAFIAGAKWLQEQDEWISVEDRLPSLSEINKPNNWKFIVCNKEDDWTDAAYLNYKKEWHNGECVINPTHWQPLPSNNKY